jgi:heme A synthase
MSYLLFYIPITLVVMLVLEACKRDDPKEIAKRASLNFGVLTVVLMIGGVLVFLVNKYL